MANPTVDKLKDLGLRHGEKLLVAAAAGLCLLFISMAINTPTIETTPDAVKAAAAAAQRTLSRPVNREELAKKFEADFLKMPDLARKVEEVANHQPIATEGLPPLVVADPSAGLLREAVALLAPYDLGAHSGRGGPLVYRRDESGELVYQEAAPAAAAPKAAPPRRRKPRGGASSPSSPSGGSRGFAPGVAFDEPAAAGAAKEDTKALRKTAKDAGEITGKAMDDEEKAAAKDDEPAADVEGKKPQEVIKGYRWVVVTGLFDYEKQRAAFARSLKLDFASAYPDFVRLEVQKRRLGRDGAWGEWEPVDREKNLEILENVPEIDKERTIEAARLKPLVDELPFLKSGSYRGVHHLALLTEAERAALKKPAAAAAANSARVPGSSSDMMARMAAMGGGARPTAGRDPGSMAADMARMAAMARVGPSSRSPGTPQSNEDLNFPRSDAPKLMVRMLDFDVEPEATYRYRARVVVHNPNYNKVDDVALGVDTRTKELEGPWSDPTPAVTVPADVATYAIAKAKVAPSNRGDEVDFQVATWNSKDGQTIVDKFPAGPGQIIGKLEKARVPDPETNKIKTTQIDFISRQLVLDTEGGSRNVGQQLGLKPGEELEVPAMAVVMRPDGSLVVRNQSRDQRDPEMKNVKDDYDDAVKEADAGKKRDSGGSKAASSSSSMYNMGMPPAPGSGSRRRGR